MAVAYLDFWGRDTGLALWTWHVLNFPPHQEGKSTSAYRVPVQHPNIPQAHIQLLLTRFVQSYHNGRFIA